jgi:hypothetical protein
MGECLAAFSHSSAITPGLRQSFAKRLRAGFNVDGFGLSEARIECNGSISS